MKKILFPSIFLISLLSVSCSVPAAPERKDVNISIFVNDIEVTSDDAGSFNTTALPSFRFTYDAEEDLKTDYKFLSGTTDLGQNVPTIEGQYKYSVSVEGNSRYKSANKEISFSLVENRLTPEIKIYFSLNKEEATEVVDDNVISIVEGYEYSFTVMVPTGVTYSTNYSSSTSNYGSTPPEELGDYSFTVTTDDSLQYCSTSRSVDFTIKTNDIPTSGTTDINIFAINDFHGQVEPSPEDRIAGLVKTYSYLKQQKNKDADTLLLDQGDTFQGSIHSNYNHGALLTDVTNYCQFTSRTVGNHDFDWGVADLKKCAESSYNNYQTPTLGANVVDYDFDTKTTKGIFRSDLGLAKTTTKVLSNGLKVGIVGVIGMEQITSITTSMSRDFVFYNHIETVKSEATKLRNESKCDVVICSVHASATKSMGYNLGDYVDLVLCGHSHQVEKYNEGDLYFAQFGYNSMYVGNVSLTYDYAKKKVTKTNIEVIDNYQLSQTSDDETITNLVDYYSTKCDTEASEVLVKNVSGNFYKNNQLPRVMVNAIYDRTVSEGYTVDLAMINVARATLYSSEAPWKYSDIYRAFPFDNMIYIADVKGSELINELVNYTNYFYRSDSFTDTSFNENQTYRVACIDYLLFHTGLRTYLGNEYYRQYDYFNVTAGKYIGVLSTNYRDILKDWLISNNYHTGKKTLSSYDYTSDNSHFIPFS